MSYIAKLTAVCPTAALLMALVMAQPAFALLKVPKIDSEKFCREFNAKNASVPDLYARCMENERKFGNLLVNDWAGWREDNKRLCLRTLHGYLRSYRDLHVCLESRS